MSDHCLCFTLRKATRKLSAIYDEALEPVGITIAQFSLLRIIAHNQPISLTELGRIAALDRSTIGRNVRVLQRDGLIAATKGEDQREAAVTLNQTGQDVLAHAEPLWEQCQTMIEARIGAPHFAALNALTKAF
jgi:DNA-binding MarR family transcriptional regulator